MNEYRIHVAGVEIAAEARGDWEALKGTGLFTDIEQVSYAQIPDFEGGRRDMWVYRVALNGAPTIATVERR